MSGADDLIGSVAAGGGAGDYLESWSKTSEYELKKEKKKLFYVFFDKCDCLQPCGQSKSFSRQPF